MPRTVLVVGAGHAGIEAALAASRLGADVRVLTLSRESIGRMSCNPAIGGLAKGQIVREIDALGGEMGRAIDATGIQFRMLNTRKGPAVRSPRAQADKDAYAAYMRGVLERECDVVEDEVLDVEPGRVRGRRGVYDADRIILTTGTFLRAIMHCGEDQRAGGRIGEGSADGLSGCLRRLGFEVGRLKTGTPPRLRRDSIDYGRLAVQHGDPEPVPFSHATERIDRPQATCWLTYTNERTHEILRANLDRAPMYTGQIGSVGPRYCPSVEDKVVRFADKPRHMVFIEPETLGGESMYCNGISTSTPADVQEAFVRTIEGLERAEFLRYGYAVEYDYAPAYQLRHTLESRAVPGLFLAGQINGTSGYEEAAGQGIVAGINAASDEPFVLARSEAYIGVMIDDLVSMQIREPYRMFTSRAEFRLLLRADNADRRLMPRGHAIGLVGDASWERLQRKERAIAAARELLRRDGRERLLRRPGVTVADLGLDIDRAAAEELEIEVKYEGYIARAMREAERLKRFEGHRIPDRLDYASLRHLKREAREKLARIRPATLAQAGRIAGVTPADVQVLMAHLRV